MYRLMVTSWENDDEYGQGGNPETRDRYFGSLSEVLYRIGCGLDGFAWGVYQKQADNSWLLYYQSI